MARAAHPDAMRPAAHPAGRERTRTAPPQLPDQFPFAGRYRAYTLFDATGAVYLLAGLVALRAVWALGTGRDAWQAQLGQLAHPLYVGFHVLALVCVGFVAVRFFGLFPKAQPPRIGPARPPPRPVIAAGLYAAWIGVSGVMAWILAGGIFR